MPGRRMSTLGCSCQEHLAEMPLGSAAVVWLMNGERRVCLEAQDHCRQSQGSGDRQEFAERQEHMATFRFGKVSASNAAYGPHCELRLTKAAALAQAAKQDAD